MCEQEEDLKGTSKGGCHCQPGGGVRSFLQARLLLLLTKKPAHGYELLEQLKEPADPGLLYRTLRQLEEGGLVRSSWSTEGSGPARRLYQLTPEGIEYLGAWAVNVRRIKESLEEFLEEFERQFSFQKGGEK